MRNTQGRRTGCRSASICLTAVLVAGMYSTLLLVGVYDLPSVIRRSHLFTCSWPRELEMAAGRQQASRPTRLMIHQDADANYAPLLDITTAHHQRYAAHHGYVFDKYVGSLSGWPYPMLNRVWKLDEMVGKAFDWFVYVDADALVYDPRCAFEDLLENRSAARFAMLFCHDPMGQRGLRHHINAGVFVANLRHPLIGPLACTWKRRLWWEAWRYQALTTRFYRRLVLGKPPEPYLEDQRILQDLLREFGSQYPALYQAVPEELCTFNTISGTLVRHVFGTSGAKARTALMRRALNSSRTALHLRKGEKVGRARGPKQREDGNSCVAMRRARQNLARQNLA